MKTKSYPDLDEQALKKLTRTELIEIILDQRQQLDALKRRQDEQKSQQINQQVNQPSSKKPEWDKDGNPIIKKKNKKKRSKRPGCGNVRKTDLEPDEVNPVPLESCRDCGLDLRNRKGTDKPGRIVEDIDPPQAKTTFSSEIEQLKWCPRCKKMVSSKTEKALPGSDIGLNATIEMAWLWVMSALSLPKIQALFQSFKAFHISTAGISKIMIRISAILQPVYDEILNDIKNGTRIWADETGWRVKGKLWWLWIFANERSAYYWADKTRGGAVVNRLLGEIFYGVLIVDGWHAYNKIVCDKQTCMAHIFRKIRAFIDAYPQYRSIMKCYLKLRRIIRDGEKLQKQRDELGETVYQRRLTLLHRRLDELLRWKNPNDILRDVIKKVRHQREHILTFVEHDGVPHHNNYGEYIIKKGVIKRKMSGGSMSEEGARAYACIQSIAMTCQLRGVSFHGFLRASLVQYIRTGKPMLLAEYEVDCAKIANKMAA
ncbi:MAG: IS66 family transposase [Pseudomonadota bacterium]